MVFNEIMNEILWKQIDCFNYLSFKTTYKKIKMLITNSINLEYIKKIKDIQQKHKMKYY